MEKTRNKDGLFMSMEEQVGKSEIEKVVEQMKDEFTTNDRKDERSAIQIASSGAKRLTTEEQFELRECLLN